jgi:hypothetical protein
MLVDAPSVLGWEQWRAIDEGRTVGAMLQAISDTGRLPKELVHHADLDAAEVALALVQQVNERTANRDGDARSSAQLHVPR